MSNPGRLREALLTLSKSRRQLWDAMFVKFEKEGKLNQSTYSLDTLDDSFEEESLFSNQVNRKNLTEKEKLIVSDVEDALDSNLKELILQREKTKLTFDRKGYKRVHPKVKQEIKRLRLCLSERDVKLYIGLCIVSNNEVKLFVEDVLRSDFKKLLLNLFKSFEFNNFGYKILKRAVLAEWKYLSKFLTQEDIVLYAVDVVTQGH